MTEKATAEDAVYTQDNFRLFFNFATNVSIALVMKNTKISVSSSQSFC